MIVMILALVRAIKPPIITYSRNGVGNLVFFIFVESLNIAVVLKDISYRINNYKSRLKLKIA